MFYHCEMSCHIGIFCYTGVSPAVGCLAIVGCFHTQGAIRDRGLAIVPSGLVPLWPLQGKACSLLEEITHFLPLVFYLGDCIGPRQDLRPTFPSTLISCLSFPNPGASLPTCPIPILCSHVLLLAGILGKLQDLAPSICPTSRLPGPFQILFSA